MTQVITPTLGLLVGLALGALGGGGSVLSVPILAFVAGMSAEGATSASLIVVGVAASIGVVGHVRNGNVRLGSGVAFGLAGIVGSRIGTSINQAIDGNLLLLLFSALIWFVSVRMYRSAGRQRPTLEHPTRLRRGLGGLVRLALAATLIGVLTGLFGVGGGFAVVPALTLLLGFETKEAIGTSLVVITINAAMALAMRIGEVAFDWSIIAPFLVTVTLGTLIGSRIANRLDADRLTRAFAVLLFAVAIYTAANAITSL